MWVGDPRGGFAHPMKDVTVNGKYYAQVFGGTMPGPIWKQSMDNALASRPATEFTLVNSFGLRPATEGSNSAPAPVTISDEIFTFDNTVPPADAATDPADTGQSEPTTSGPAEPPPAPPVEPAPPPPADGPPTP